MEKRYYQAKPNPQDLKEEIINKIKLLSTEISDELTLHEKIFITLPKDYRKQIEAFRKRINKASKKIDSYQTAEKIMELEDHISDIEDKLHKLMEQSPIKNKQFDKCSEEARNNIAAIFIKMRAKMAIIRLKRKILLDELNNLNLLFIFGIVSLAQKDEYYHKNPHIHHLRFSDNDISAKKIAFALLRLRSAFLSERLTYETPTTDPLKERFVDCFIRINHDKKDGLFADDEDKVHRIKAFAQSLMKKSYIPTIQECKSI